MAGWALARQRPLKRCCRRTALTAWGTQTPYAANEDWIFADPGKEGALPYRGQYVFKKYVLPAVRRTGFRHPVGWHAFRQYDGHSARRLPRHTSTGSRPAAPCLDSVFARLLYGSAHRSETPGASQAAVVVDGRERLVIWAIVFTTGDSSESPAHWYSICA
jgi:hypothetical protein